MPLYSESFNLPSWVSREVCGPGGLAVDQTITAESSGKEEELLKLYHQSFDDELVDLDLIMDLLHHICCISSDGEPPGFSSSRVIFVSISPNVPSVSSQAPS